MRDYLVPLRCLAHTKSGPKSPGIVNVLSAPLPVAVITSNAVPGVGNRWVGKILRARDLHNLLVVYLNGRWPVDIARPRRTIQADNWDLRHHQPSMRIRSTV